MDEVFLSNVFEFLKLSFGLSIESIHEIEWSKVTWWNRTKESWIKSKVFGTEWQMFFCFFTFNSRADIITRYNFGQVRWFFFTFNIDFMVELDTTVRYMNNKFQVLTNIYVCIQYFIGFTFLKNAVLLVRYLPVIW